MKEGSKKEAYQELDLKFDLKSRCNDSVHEFCFSTICIKLLGVPVKGFRFIE